ncbi:hypothetical protein T484DRAFT_1797250 [Baffinella frigidus]|nr:hypothetical protein T484DRAFT_1797250 [Cryptophyta sp. CCMP2293]
MPEDGLPIIGFVEGSCATRPPSLYVAVMHSGITLGPVSGALIALEIVEGVNAAPLEPFRLSRASLRSKYGTAYGRP